MEPINCKTFSHSFLPFSKCKKDIYNKNVFLATLKLITKHVSGMHPLQVELMYQVCDFN